MTNEWPKPWDRIQTVEQAAATIKACKCEGGRYVELDGVPIGHPLYHKPVPCICWREEQGRRRAKRLLEEAGLTDGAFSMTLDGFHPERCVPNEKMSRPEAIRTMKEAKACCQAFAKEPKGWIVLMGQVGCGKTHLAVGIVNALLSQEKAVHFASVPQMLQQLRGSFEDHKFDDWLDDLRKVEVPVLDDLGAEVGTDWANETLFQITDYRYINKLPLVVTTNKTLEGRGGLTDKRIASRLKDKMLSKVFVLPAGDYRQVGR